MRCARLRRIPSHRVGLSPSRSLINHTLAALCAAMRIRCRSWRGALSVGKVGHHPGGGRRLRGILLSRVAADGLARGGSAAAMPGLLWWQLAAGWRQTAAVRCVMSCGSRSLARASAALGQHGLCAREAALWPAGDVHVCRPRYRKGCTVRCTGRLCPMGLCACRYTCWSNLNVPRRHQWLTFTGLHFWQ